MNYSFEVLPPLKGTGTQSLFGSIDRLMEFKPRCINITTHRSEYVYTEQPDGTFTKSRIRRRPGTVAVASAIQQKYNVTVVPHVVCSGSTAEDIEYMLLDLQFLGISDIFLLRGDKAADEKRFTPIPGGYAHATQLIEHVNTFNNGHFIDGTEIKVTGTPFTYGVAAYPEKHEEAPNLDFDINMLLRKQQLGAKYAITQLFFDNTRYYQFVDHARQAGVTIPIIPGLKPLTRKSQLTIIPKTFHVDIPDTLTTEAMHAPDDAAVARIGIEWARQQCRDLEAHGIDCIHFYTMAAVDSVCKIIKE